MIFSAATYNKLVINKGANWRFGCRAKPGGMAASFVGWTFTFKFKLNNESQTVHEATVELDENDNTLLWISLDDTETEQLDPANYNFNLTGTNGTDVIRILQGYLRVTPEIA